jgi:hypothetical protein
MGMKGWELGDAFPSLLRVDALHIPWRLPKRSWAGGSASGKNSMYPEARRKAMKVNYAFILSQYFTEIRLMILCTFMKVRK